MEYIHLGEILDMVLATNMVVIEGQKTYQVAVTDLEGLVDTLADLTGRSLPCAVTQKTCHQLASTSSLVMVIV